VKFLILRQFLNEPDIIRQPVASRRRASERDCNEIISDPYCRDKFTSIRTLSYRHSDLSLFYSYEGFFEIDKAIADTSIEMVFDLVKESLLNSEIWLPKPREEIFSFFGGAHNLEIITPPWLRFEILTQAPIEMLPGTIINYRISLHGIQLRWRTKIVIWEPPNRFIDVQIKGPYQQWHHEHIFESQDNGTLCRDCVRYAVPGGPLVDRLLVRGDVEKIFAFRREKLLALFA
jgi:ligand-binding SRPBCC domain-containing protein